MKCRYIILLAAGLFLRHGTANAQPKGAEVSPGMTYGQVVETLGEPKNRQSFESKREDLWSYDSLTVNFKGGKVTSWKPIPGTELYHEMELAREAELAIRPTAAPESAKIVDEIFTEIMKDVQ